ncbi:hypothetical protein WG947_09900 [Pontibacter sp. H259]|uniref:hypothetical protein n=1 Tax=Pontibacter sp. H259 TaxID=3133421 RepID=UPI0030C47CA3
MVKLLRFLVLLLYTLPLLAQEPTITWGPEIPQQNRNLNRLQVIGLGANNTFYTQYTQQNQVTLERYDQHNQRTWAVAIAPQSPDGNLAAFEELVILNRQAYLILSVKEKFKKDIYLQQIDGNGNYMPEVSLLASTLPDAAVFAKTLKGSLLLVLQQQQEPQQTSVSLFRGSLTPVWTTTTPVKGEISELHLSETGTAFILTKLPATNSPEAAFYLYRFGSRTGLSTMQPIGSTAQRPLQAKLASSGEDIVVAGTTSPAPFVASLLPEPTGTFFYRFPKGRFRKVILHYNPIDSLFLSNYKRYKPDQDHSQRLRHLQLKHLLPLTNNKLALLGEVYTVNGSQQIAMHHTDDILVTTFNASGRPIYTTSANKHQTTSVKETRLGSYIVSSDQDILKLVYLDFEYNYNEKDEIIMASPRAVLKTPVLVTITPDGKQTARPLRNTETGRHQNFYLVPTSAYKVNANEFIVLGVGKGYYKFGRFTF